MCEMMVLELLLFSCYFSPLYNNSQRTFIQSAFPFQRTNILVDSWKSIRHCKRSDLEFLSLLSSTRTISRDAFAINTLRGHVPERGVRQSTDFKFESPNGWFSHICLCLVNYQKGALDPLSFKFFWKFGKCLENV